MKLINKFKSSSFDKRKNNNKPSLIVIHYTAMLDCDEAIAFLLNPINKVSSHFLISKKGEIYNLVDIKNRAWHAGISYWRGDKDINSSSIGIELDNSGPLNLNENFSLLQKKALIELLLFLQKKLLINSSGILGHSDIAPYRKIDPGLKFPWSILCKKNIAYFPKKMTKLLNLQLDNYFLNLSLNSKKLMSLHMLGIIGYDVKPAYNNKSNYSLLIKAYQLHYNNKKVTGKLDHKTFLIIKSHFKENLIKIMKT